MALRLLLLTGAIVYAFDTEEEMLLSFRHFVQDCRTALQSAQSALSRERVVELGDTII